MNPTRRGFTIIELMITMVILAILTALAFPTISTAMAESRLRDALNEFRFDLGEARARATERNLAIVVEMTTPGLAPGGTFTLWESTTRDCSTVDTAVDVPLIGPIDLTSDRRWRDTGLTRIEMGGTDQGGALELCIRPDGGVYKRPALTAITGPVQFFFNRFESGSPEGVERILRLNFNGLPRIER